MSEPTPTDDVPRRPRPPGSIRLGRIAGADVLVTSSWFVIAALIAVVVSPRVEQVRPGLGAGTYAVGLVFAMLLYGSVLLHEISHAVVAKRLGYPVTSITLHFLGGMTAVEGEARRPREEFWIAVVGPLTSIAVGAAALAAWFALPDEGLLRLLVEGLAGANLLVGVLNLVPGLPLDGGRILKALVWRVSGSQHRGALAAGWGGRIVAVLVLLWPLVLWEGLGVRPDLVDYLLALVLGAFLWTGATAAMAHARLRRKLPGLVARPLARRTLTVPGDLPLAEAVRRAREAGAGSVVTLVGGRPTGIVSEAAVVATPEDRHPWVPVSSVARTLDEGLTLPASIAGEELILAISRRPAEEYLLVEDSGAIYGVLTTADVDKAFRATHH